MVNEPLAELAALVGAVERRIVLFLEMRRTLDRHRAADIIIGSFDFFAVETEQSEQIEVERVVLFGREAEALQGRLHPASTD